MRDDDTMLEAWDEVSEWDYEDTMKVSYEDERSIIEEYYRKG